MPRKGARNKLAIWIGTAAQEYVQPGVPHRNYPAGVSGTMAEASRRLRAFGCDFRELARCIRHKRLDVGDADCGTCRARACWLLSCFEAALLVVHQCILSDMAGLGCLAGARDCAKCSYIMTLLAVQVPLLILAIIKLSQFSTRWSSKSQSRATPMTAKRHDSSASHLVYTTHTTADEIWHQFSNAVHVMKQALSTNKTDVSETNVATRHFRLILPDVFASSRPDAATDMP